MKLIKISLVLLYLMVAVSVWAVQKELKFSKLDFNYRKVSAQDTTVVGLDRGKLRRMGKVNNWGMIEAYYESIPKWADDVEVIYYVLMKSKLAKKPVMLAGSVVYMHVEKGKKHISTIYIPPQAIRRYGDASRIRAELWYNGILQDAVLWPRTGAKAPWWNRIKPIRGSLLNRFYTPFEHEMQITEEVIKI